ncbi:MAG: SDR family NAD(P)-dependent oxidoreductase [Verrucomicrobiales bacterium]
MVARILMDTAMGKTIVVTGASSGIGRELVLQLAEPGVDFWLLGRDQGRLEKVAAEAVERGAAAKTQSLDLRDREQSAAFLNETFAEGVEVVEVYLSAAFTMFGEVKDLRDEDWQRIYETNLLGAVQWALHFFRVMVARGGGRIVVLSSLAAYTGYPTAAAYATMKAGLLGLFRSLWYEGRRHGVFCQIVSPGYVDTNIYKAAVFRNTTYEKTVGNIRKLGFPMLTAEETAVRIIRNVRKGKRQYVLPQYAALMAWIAPRAPFLIDRVHREVVKRFRER